MKHFLGIMGLLFALITAKGVTATEMLVAKNAKVRAPIPGMSNTAGYVALTNPTDKPIVLIGAASALAQKVEFHDHIMKNGVMRMVKLDQITLKPKQTIEFKSGGLHIMFLGINPGFEKKSSVKVTLQDAQGNQFVQEFAIQSVHHEHHHH